PGVRTLSNASDVMPMPEVSVALKLVTFDQVAPASDDCQRPSRREPKKIMFELNGLTARRSPAQCLSSLPPILRSMLSLLQVAPWSVDLKIVPVVAHDAANLPQAM